MKYYIVFSERDYYVSYNDKVSDTYSNNYIEAKRYKTLGSALSRAGLNYKKHVAVIELKKIDEKIKNSTKIQRRKKLQKLSGKKYELDRKSVV